MVRPNTPVGCCLYCGGELERRGFLWVCKECGEAFEPDEVGFPDGMPDNPYRKRRRETE